MPTEPHDFVTRVEWEPENDRAGYMDAFDELVTGPVDSVHIERLSDNLYWMAIYKGEARQVVVIAAKNLNAHVIGRTEPE